MTYQSYHHYLVITYHHTQRKDVCSAPNLKRCPNDGDANLRPQNNHMCGTSSGDCCSGEKNGHNLEGVL